MTAPTHVSPNRPTKNVWRTLGLDPLVQVNLLALLAYTGLLILVGDGLPGWHGNAAAVFFVGLTLLAMRTQLSRIRAPEDRAFWTDLSRATAWWLTVPILYLALSQGERPRWSDWAADVLYALFYVSLYVALALRPHHRHRWRPVALERSLTWATVVISVSGLFLYFLVPLFVDPAGYDSRRSATGLFLILDAYFSLRLLHLSRTVDSSRWRVLYAFLAAGVLSVLANDILGGLYQRGFLKEMWWGTFFAASWRFPCLFFLLSARARHHPFPVEALAPRVGYPSDDSFPGPLGQTMIFALVFPLIHFTGYQSEAMNLASKEPRAVVVFLWLLLLTAVAFYQHYRLVSTTTHLRAERSRTERALRRIEDDLRLRQQLQSVAAERTAAQDIFAKAFQASPDVMAISRLDDSFLLDVNASCSEVFGYAPQELIGRRFDQLDLWARPRHRLALEQLLQESRSVRELSSLFRKKSGQLGVGLFSAERIDLDGVPHVFSITHEVTDHRHQDEGLARRAALLGEARSAVCSIDAEGRIHYWNEAAERLFGLAASEVLGRDALELPGCGKLLGSPASGSALTQTLHRDGHILQVTSQVFPVAGPDGGARLVIAAEVPLG